MTERDTLDEPVLPSEELPVETLKTLLASAAPPDENRAAYADRLLHHALDTRDSEATSLLAGLMDTDAELDQRLDARLNDALYTQPDAVYAFIRAHLNEKFDERWLPRLKIAALFSLRVAIKDGDAETLINWLTLIAREPANFDLGDVLHYGILAAQPRAYENPELARQLVTLAVKRAPGTLDALLAAPELLAALPNNLGLVLRDFTGDPLALLQNKGQELFVVGLARAASASAGAVFTPAAIVQVWELYTNPPSTANLLPPAYRADSIVQVWIDRGAQFLDGEALETILTLMLASRRDDLLLPFIHQPDASHRLIPLLIHALGHSQRPVNEVIDLVGRILAAGDMTPQQAADLYSLLLNNLEWRRDALPLAQQLARTFQQYPALDIEAENLWRLLNLAAETRDELVARIALKRLVGLLETQEDEALLAEDVRRLYTQTQWSENAQLYLTNWWRVFLRNLPLNRLQRLDRALDGKRPLEDERAILQTLIAIRRILGPRSLSEFAKEVSTVYQILEALAESFDPNPKRQISFDQPILRTELEARQSELSPQERQILANNLKELAHIIAEMGDNRTKANLMRRGEELDRDLMSGEQSPHSAVDAMKWLAGYWGGTDKSGQG